MCLTVTFISVYVNNGSQKTKTASYFSDFADILFDVLQALVAKALVFNTYTCDLLIVHNDTKFTSFADDVNSKPMA